MVMILCAEIVRAPEAWHIFYFVLAYFPSYWHMPFEFKAQFSQTSTVSPQIIYFFWIVFPEITLDNGPKIFVNKG